EAEAVLRLSMRWWNSPRHVCLQGDAEILRRLGWILQSQGKDKEAEDALRKAIEVANGFTPAQWRRHGIGSPLYFQVELAGLYDRMRRHDEAEALFGKARDELMGHMSLGSATRLFELRLDRVRSSWWTKQRQEWISEDDERLARSLVDMLRRDE